MVGTYSSLNEALFPAIYDDGDGFLSTNGIEELKGIVEKEVGFSFDLRACRRTFGQMCLDQGISVEAVSIALGHAPTKTTENFYCRKKEDFSYFHFFIESALR